MNENIDYNTQRSHLAYTEYGRNVEQMVAHILTIPEKEKRTRMAHTTIAVMATLNPAAKEMEDYKHKLWDHIHAIADFKLDIDSPYPVPTVETINKKPDVVPYQGSPIKFRYYGRNCQNMVKKAAEMEASTTKNNFVDLLASFMKNSSKNWNNEALTEAAIVKHLEVMSEGNLQITAEDLNITEQQNFRRKPNFVRNNNNNNPNNKRSFGNKNGNNNNKFGKPNRFK